jgi:SOS-response transcriptional repressor LexA
MLDELLISQTHTARSIVATGAKRLADAVDEDRDRLRAWLRQNLEDQGITATKAAKSIGVATTTLTKFLNDPAYTFTPSTPVVSKLERLFGRAAPRAASSGALPQIEAGRLALEDVPPAQRKALAALTGDRRSVEAWTVYGDALQAAGVMPGDVLLVDLDEVARAGDIVCAEIHEQGTRRTVFRLYQKPYLVPATFAAGSWMPIVVDDRNVIVRGVVTDRLAGRRPS